MVMPATVLSALIATGRHTATGRDSSSSLIRTKKITPWYQSIVQWECVMS